jgi:hypothetical protein
MELALVACAVCSFRLAHVPAVQHIPLDLVIQRTRTEAPKKRTKMCMGISSITHPRVFGHVHYGAVRVLEELGWLVGSR